ncbi:MAG: glutathione S-transferase family protein [Pseudomonadota bacterium]
MIYKLFYADDSAAMGVRVLLEQIGAEYELIDTSIAKDAPRHADHLALNPNGWVPVLAWDGRAMYEAAAITIFLTDLYPNACLGPAPDDPDRALFLQTLVYFSNTVQTAFQQYYYAERFAEDAAGCAGAMARGVQRLREVWQVVDDQIGDNTWMIGNRFTAADVHLYMLSTWLDPAGGHPMVSDFPNVARVVANAAGQDCVKKVYGL